MKVEDVIAALDEELARQAREEDSMPYVGETFGDEVIIDGNVNLRQLAEAVMRIYEPLEGIGSE